MFHTVVHDGVVSVSNTGVSASEAGAASGARSRLCHCSRCARSHCRTTQRGRDPLSRSTTRRVSLAPPITCMTADDSDDHDSDFSSKVIAS